MDSTGNEDNMNVEKADESAQPSTTIDHEPDDSDMSISQLVPGISETDMEIAIRVLNTISQTMNPKSRKKEKFKQQRTT